jgi:D-aminopeptidase
VNKSSELAKTQSIFSETIDLNNNSYFKRVRLRDLGIPIGEYPTGPLNAITDVPGVLVGQVSLVYDEPCTARTGVTAIFPREDIYRDFAFAGFYSFNGIGEMTGLPYIAETGLLTSPILLTNTNQLGLAHQALSRYGSKKHDGFTYKLPVVAETYDGWLNEIDAFPLKEEHFFTALDSANSGSVLEGNSGGGTGMICYEFKGGTGTASRQLDVFGNIYTLGVLVQANHGNRGHLRVDGKPVGQWIPKEIVPSPWTIPPVSSSIIIIIATDAPMLAIQCRRLAQRATIGLARTGGYGLSTSGDLFLAFSTGIHYVQKSGEMIGLKILPESSIDPFVMATAEAVEEAILNSLVAAETMTGYHDHTAYAIPHDLLLDAVNQS